MRLTEAVEEQEEVVKKLQIQVKLMGKSLPLNGKASGSKGRVDAESQTDVVSVSVSLAADKTGGSRNSQIVAAPAVDLGDDADDFGKGVDGDDNAGKGASRRKSSNSPDGKPKSKKGFISMLSTIFGGGSSRKSKTGADASDDADGTADVNKKRARR